MPKDLWSNAWILTIIKVFIDKLFLLFHFIKIQADHVSQYLKRFEYLLFITILNGFIWYKWYVLQDCYLVNTPDKIIFLCNLVILQPLKVMDPDHPLAAIVLKAQQERNGTAAAVTNIEEPKPTTVTQYSADREYMLLCCFSPETWRTHLTYRYNVVFISLFLFQPDTFSFWVQKLFDLLKRYTNKPSLPIR